MQLNHSLCADVTVDGTAHNQLTCVAPSGSGRVALRVVVGGGTATYFFAYDRPSISHVVSSPMDAAVEGMLQVEWVLSSCRCTVWSWLRVREVNVNDGLADG